MLRPSGFLTAVFLALTAASVTPAVASTELYVAVDGDDRWSGRLAAPDAEASDGPLATLAAARDAVRALRRLR